MVSICCNKSSDKIKNSSKETKSSRRKKKWNPLSCLVCRGCCSCRDKTSDKKKESSRKAKDRKQLGCFRCRGERVMGCSCCENSSNDQNKNPSKEKRNEGKGKNRLACLACRGEKRMGCLCCAKSSDESIKSSRTPRMAKEQNEEKNFIAKSSDKSNKSSRTENKQQQGKEGKKGCCFFGAETSNGTRKIEEHKREKKKMRFACLFHRGESGCFCCAKSSDKNKAPSRNTKELEDEKKRKRILCCAQSSAENKKALRKKNEQRKGSQLAFLVNSISINSDGDRQKSEADEILRIGNDSIAARVFHYHELSAATRNFKPECLLGEGGFGRVYKGKLEDTNQIVAVKQLDRNGFQGNREFLVEVLMLSLLHHENLVKMLGYCSEGDQRILVYEYMPLGSLEDHLLAISANRKPLDWNTRMKIALGAAKGLEYLHEIANPPVIYRDFKAPNILLDEDYNPKLSDFGLAKLGPMGDKSHVSTRVMGTYGYCAPEYAKTGQLTKMSDVYSFGVVLLEIITGRRAFDVRRPRNEQQLVHWAAPFFKDKRYFVKMADPLLQGKYPLRALYQAVAVAAMCIQDGACTRPGISDVVIALEYLSLQTDDLSEGSKGEIPRTGSEIETCTVGN